MAREGWQAGRGLGVGVACMLLESFARHVPCSGRLVAAWGGTGVGRRAGRRVGGWVNRFLLTRRPRFSAEWG